MSEPVVQLFPQPVQERPLEGLYLADDLQQQSLAAGRSLVYSTFVVSLDGRIAIPRSGGPGLTVPESIANERDWRLYQELAAQADLIISSGRYLREWAEGGEQEILQTDRPRFADLRDWRQARDLPPQPDIAVISGSLRFHIPEVLTSGGRKVIVFTRSDPDPDRVKAIEGQGGQVVVAGKESVTGELLAQHAAELGYRSIYSSAGPKVLHLLLSGGVVDRLYLTHAHRILGGQPYASLVEGDLLERPFNMTLRSVYYDPSSPDEVGQLFVRYDRT